MAQDDDRNRYRDHGRPDHGYEGEEYPGRRPGGFEEGAGGHVEPYRDRREARRGSYQGGGFHRDEGGFGPEQYGRDYGQSFDYGRRGRGDETYGLGGYGAQGYGEAYGSRGASGRQGGGRRQEADEYDPFYHQWREEQMRRLDQDYEEWRRERQARFNEEFERWREERRRRQGGEVEAREEVPERKGRG